MTSLLLPLIVQGIFGIIKFKLMAPKGDNMGAKSSVDKLMIGNSKTLTFNVLIPLMMAISGKFGFELSAEAWVGIATIGNFVLRFFTEKGMGDK